MEIDFSKYPPEIIQVLEHKKYALAKKMCEEKGLPTQEIDFAVKKAANKANDLIRDKKDYSQAMSIYLTIIGAVDPSLVLCKFVSPHLTSYLMTFLIELHKRGYATEAHTKLLFQLFKDESDHTSSTSQTKFQEFLNLLKRASEQVQKNMKSSSKEGFFTKLKIKNQSQKDEDEEDLSNFYYTFKQNAGSAINVLRKNGMADEAFQLSNILPITAHRVSLLIESQCNYLDASQMIFDECKNDPQNGRNLLFEYGPQLLQKQEKVSKEDHDVVVETIVQAAVYTWENCTDNQPKKYTTLFWGHPVSYYKFLKFALTKHQNFYFTTDLIDLCIPRAYDNTTTDPSLQPFFGAKEVQSQGKPEDAIALIKNPNSNFDMNQILFICNEVGFTDGVLAILERENQTSTITNYYIAECERLIQQKEENLLNEMLKKFIKWLSKFQPKEDQTKEERLSRSSSQTLLRTSSSSNLSRQSSTNLTNPEELKNDLDGEDWVSIFQFFIRNYNSIPVSVFPGQDEISKRVFIEKVILRNAERERPLTSLLAYMSKYNDIPFAIAKGELSSFIESNYDEEVEEHEKLLQQIKELESEIKQIEGDNIEIRPMRCDECGNKLEQPYICFMCGHQLHRHCCKFGEGNVPLCPICQGSTTPKVEVERNMDTITIDQTQPDLLDQVISLIHNGYFDNK